MAQKKVQVVNTSGAQTNVASEEAILLLRKIVMLLESSAVVDASRRQRVTIDAVGATGGAASTNVNTTVPISGTVAVSAGTANIGQVVVGFGGQASAAANIIDSRFMMIDTARNAYANGIRSKLSWS
jgi:hypothetical protein